MWCSSAIVAVKEALGDKVACARGKDGHAVSVSRRSTLTVLRQANDIDIELQSLPGLEVLLLLQGVPFLQVIDADVELLRDEGQAVSLAHGVIDRSDGAAGQRRTMRLANRESLPRFDRRAGGEIVPLRKLFDADVVGACNYPQAVAVVYPVGQFSRKPVPVYP